MHKELEKADYLTLYNELIKDYSNDDILETLFELYNIQNFNIKLAPEPIKISAISLLGGVFSLQRKHLPLAGYIFNIKRQGAAKNIHHHIKDQVDSARIDYESNQSTYLMEASSSISTRNKIERIRDLMRVYSDIVEGRYSKCLTKLTFSIDILTGKLRSINTLESLSVKDKLSIVESYDKYLQKRISEPYNSIIRNASSHYSFEIVEFPIVKLVDRRPDGKKRIISESISNLEKRTLNIFSISEAIDISGSVLGLHPVFRPAIEHFDFSKYRNLIDNRDNLRKMKTYKRNI